MTKDSNNKSLHPRIVLGALAGLGCLPGAASARSVVDVAQSVEAPTGSSSPADFSSEEQVDAATNVKTREVEWAVPWIAPAPIASTTTKDIAPSSIAEPAAAEPYGGEPSAGARAVDNNQLAMAFAEDVAIAQSAQIDYPLISVGSSHEMPETPAEPNADKAPAPADASLISFGIKAEGEDDFTFTGRDAALIAAEPVTEDAPVETVASVDTPLLLLEAEADDEEPQTLFQADAPLLALATTEEKQSSNTLAPLIAVVDTVQAPPVQKKAPWLASALPSSEAAEAETVEVFESLVPKLALLAEEDETAADSANQNAPQNAPWIALVTDEDDASQKAPWLARSLANGNEQTQATPSAPRLAVALPRRDANKRPSDWISLTPA
ncbi:MAG: hypothetical protein ABG776_14115, partial [Cyanobacteria bacterium J06555_13]